ncbi:MAG: hypothetical protein KDI01_05305 [Halioglobus sp.]|nr:hypothetical protein [Halioglobus sp.]
MSARAGRVLPLLAALLLLGGTAWLYWPGAQGPAMLDDRSNVAVVANLEGSTHTASDYVFGNRSGPLGRPVSMLSFVAEQLYLDGGTAGSKRINILLHLLNGALVMYLLSLLLAHAAVPAPRWFALLFGCAWLLSPLYVSTVLYVVQRMAMLSTLFMLLACIVYVHWRRVLFRGVPVMAGFALLCACIALAVLSKENGILIVPVLVLLEVLWFRGRRGASDDDSERNPALYRCALTLLWLGAVAAVALLALRFDSILAGYARRDFTLTERLLSQARVLWDYIGQLLWPELPRMGLFHDDFALSMSLFEPGSTLYAVAAWLLLVPLALLLLRWRSGALVVCALSIFLVGHAVESSVFALELYFEHRNYFPGVGLFLALAVLLGRLCARWPQCAAPVLAWSAVYVLLLAVQTGSQVQIWSSAPLLRLNYVNQHPDSFRANEEMAIHLAGVGALEHALAYSQRAGELSTTERAGDRQIRDLALYCLANRPVPDHMLQQLGTIEPRRPFAVVSTFQGFAKVLQRGACPDFDRIAFADRMAQLFLAAASPATASPNYYAILAGIENDLQRYDRAFAYTEKLLELAPRNVQGLLMQLHFATALGRDSKAASAITQLRQLQDEGRLNRGEIQTFELYL